MPINKDGTNITAVRYTPVGDTQKTITQVIYVDTGGTQTAVFGAQVSSPTINTPSTITYNSVTFTVLNTYDEAVDIYARIGSGTWVLKSSIPANTTTTYSFTSLNSNTTYTISAYATLTGHANSATATKDFTTPTVYTATPSISIITNVWNSLTWRITNEDTASALITTGLFASNGTSQIGDTQTITIDAGATYDFTQGSLSASTTYYIKRSAAATDGKLSTSYIQSGPHTTAARETLAKPSVVLGTITGTSISWYAKNNSTHTVQIISNVDSTASWPYQDTSVAPDANSDTWTKTGLAIGSTHSIYARAIDPSGFYAESAVAEALTSTLSQAATPSLANIAGATTSTLNFRITNNDTSSATYTWYLGDWSKYDTGSVGGNGGTSDFTVTGLSSGTTYTVYVYVSVANKVDSANASSTGTTSTPIVYYEVKWYDFEGGYIPNSARTYAAGSICQSTHYPSNPQVPNCRTWNGWNKAAGFAVNQNWSISPNSPNLSIPGDIASLSVDASTPGMAKLTWGISSCATSYWVSYTTTSGGTYGNFVEVSNRSYSYTNLTGGKYYWFRVRGSNNGYYQDAKFTYSGQVWITA